MQKPDYQLSAFMFKYFKFMNFFGGAYKVSKKLFKVCLILLISIQFIFSSPVFAESENLVKNPGFEEGNDESVYFWQTHCWEKAEGVTEFFIDESVYHSGGKVRA